MGKKRILVVDDEWDFTRVLKVNLEEMGGYEVLEENRPERALGAARAFKPDLILLDVIMPNVLGSEVAAQLKADETLKDTPVVFLTSVVSREEAKKHDAVIGGHPFIAKPVSPEDLLVSIEKYLGKGAEQRTMPDEKSEQTEDTRIRKKRILLIDDDPDFTRLLKLNLEQTGTYEVKEENHPERALAAARAFNPDLIFLDLMMPNMLGGKVLAQLEADSELKETPVVFFSAVVPAETKKQKGTIAGRPFITKPASPEEVIETIEKYLLQKTKEPAMASSEPRDGGPTQKKRILLVDDEEDFITLLKMNIESTGEYEALVATSGEAGLEVVKKHKPDLVLLDISMPGMDGLETLRRIKDTAPDIPVAMVTAVFAEEEAKRCFSAGAYEYITKPVDFEYLKTALLVKLF